MEFERVDFGKYGTTSIKIREFTIILDDEAVIGDRQIGNFKDDQYPVILSKDQTDELKQIENKMNDYLKDQDLPLITMVWGNKIYPKITKDGQMTNHIITVKGVFVKKGNSYPQLRIH